MIGRGVVLLVVTIFPSVGILGVSLTSIDFSSTDTTWVMEVKLTDSTGYKYFYLEDRRPYMFVLDLENTVNGLTRRRVRVSDAFPILSVRNSQFKLKPRPVSRVVVDMTRRVPVKIEREENSIVVTFKRGVIRRIVSEGRGLVGGIEIEASTVYRPLGKKDPFSEPKLAPEDENLPDVVDAKLTGIVTKEGGEKYVLIKDRSGKGWVIREGERVKGGRLIRIGKNFATFLIRELGVLKRVELTMEKGKEERTVTRRRR